MILSVKQKSNIRHFIYYLVNGTLDFELIQNTFKGNFYQILKDNPNFFYKTSCVFINQEIALNPNWPDTKKLGKFICHLHSSKIDITDFKDWELDFDYVKPGFSNDFKQFTKWFLESEVVENISFADYIESGASFVEQCFAIWANVIELKNDIVANSGYSTERVEQYIKSYFIPGFKANLEEWECQLHME